MSTTSIGITKWANGSKITEICRAGEGDNRVIAWRRTDGAVALETNGDPVFGDEAQAWINDQDHGTIHNYKTGEAIRPATAIEEAESKAAAERDGGSGVITVDGISCYVA